MAYKTILVHVDGAQQAAQRIRVAADLAKTEEAHLVGAALADIAPFVFYIGGGFDTIDPDLANQFDLSRKAAAAALQSFDAQAAAIGANSVERRLLDGEAWIEFCLQARYSDLVVIGQSPSDADAPRHAVAFSDYVLLNCPRPLMIIPSAWQSPRIGQRILIAWNASMAAARAVASAIPLLRRASQVELVVFNPGREAPDVHGAEPGADIALYLARHAVHVNVRRQSTDADIGLAMMRCADDCDADLIVMGAYGHSRFRELMLGGVTRTVMRSMTVPVLLAC